MRYSSRHELTTVFSLARFLKYTSVGLSHLVKESIQHD
jgi:hypothetical protein